MFRLALIAQFAAESAAAAKIQPESVKLRIQLIDDYCSAESKLHKTATQKAVAQKMLPCQMLAYRQTLNLTGAEKRKAMEAKGKTFEIGLFRRDRIAIYGAMCKPGTPYAEEKMCKDAAVKKYMNIPVGFKGKGKGKGGLKPKGTKSKTAKVSGR